MQTAASLTNTVTYMPPEIHQRPRSDNENEQHYGYVAYKSISLMDSTGFLYQVQPAHSPFRCELPARVLIPFTNMFAARIVEAPDQGVLLRGELPSPVRTFPQSAFTSAQIIRDAYTDWVFKILTPLTGLSGEDAGHIFQTIQPFLYNLRHLGEELEFGAVDRIANTESYKVTYKDTTIVLNPLPEKFKQTALDTLALMRESADKAFELADNVKQGTIQQMTQFFATGTGKRQTDPHDKYIFTELETEVPKLLDNVNQPQQVVTTESPESFDLRRRAVEMQEREYALRLREQEFRENQAALAAVSSQPKTDTPLKPASTVTSIGKTVTVHGQTGVITANRFGKITVKMTDGSELTFANSEID